MPLKLRIFRNRTTLTLISNLFHQNQLRITYKFIEHLPYPYGNAYANESIQLLRASYGIDNKERLIAYKAGQPVGILDIIVSDNTIEIDGFGVLPNFQKTRNWNCYAEFCSSLCW
ncbi:acetyltransferase [Staphylococcus gallinarum]|uniref:Acetyltransferase n=1 Tax=Staphylococcus gallinarum TaxID=1293 RepID=A0A380FM16_STAGA|nr:acetyltransferase [Staphylococcus gallinarum]